MIEAQLSFVAEAVGGERSGADVLISGVSIDSRTAGNRQLFIPIAGETFDGHAFVKDALARGCVAFLWERHRPLPAALRDDPHVLVESGVDALQALATAYRVQCNARVIGVTGSNGKTTTKDMLATVLQKRFKTAATVGNLNNEFGLPLSILAWSKNTEVAILEMGMRGSGQIAALCRIAQPDIGAITLIGEAHLELLGSRSAIADAKWELVEALPKGSFAVLPDDEPLLKRAPPTGVRVITFGESEQADVRVSAYESRGVGGAQFVLDPPGCVVQLAAPGIHLARNGALVYAIARELGMADEVIVEALGSYVSSAGRQALEELAPGVLLIDDAYNASPTSMARALEVLRDMPHKKKLAVLGDMREIGEPEAEKHVALGESLAAFGVTQLMAVGCHSAAMERGARQAKIADVEIFASAQEAVERVVQNVQCAHAARSDIVILVKASRAVGLECVSTALREAFAALKGE
ncbi:UDP-N-acetylmuramoyl-tripeptide--D-alanyl-D-alanine ligase [Ferroacidibacillus organovorans]|uniref:UDP-N-acetylmuramoyl-tripeptide--D-alanyl-D-alanine ligase n=1 Tax=Ferroacidibacillus organovorans TaxID=1765683 RepID=A0A1V4ETY7_9BACL|nr:UDP-N-acetylmuramoyl-tripeptide--D-alanyl-D-alanine ligase [Ferroacidibacillus organovorans]OPG16224.1 hypothetical protein B2M26_07900 [Ferroacidibacillus organovorans]